MIASAEYKSPRVYLKSLETEPLSPLLSSVTGFVGVAEKGPLNLPQSICNWGEYLTIFGSFVSYSHLAESVYGFFLNGGERCYIVRVGCSPYDSSDEKKDIWNVYEQLQKASKTILDELGNNSIKFEAINEGRWGNSIKIEISGGIQKKIELSRLAHAANSSDNEIVVDFIYDFMKGDKIWITHRDDKSIIKSYEIIDINEESRSISLNNTLDEEFPDESVVSGYGFRLSVTCIDKREIFDNLSMNPDNHYYFKNIINGDPSVINYIEKARNGNSIIVTVVELEPIDSSSWFKPKPDVYKLENGGDGSVYAQGTLIDDNNNDSIAVYSKKRGSDGNTIQVATEEFCALTALPVPYGSNVVTVNNITDFIGTKDSWLVITDGLNTEEREIVTISKDKNEITLQSILSNEYPEASKITIKHSPADKPNFNIIIKQKEKDDPLEQYNNLNIKSSRGRFFKTVINDGLTDANISASEYIRVSDTSPSIDPPQLNSQIPLAGGKHPSEIAYEYYTGYTDSNSYFTSPNNDNTRFYGLSALELVDEVSLVSIPDLDWIAEKNHTKNENQKDFILAQKQILFHCEKMGERFAILDSMHDTKPMDITQWPLHFENKRSSKFGAFYYPWLFCTFDGKKKCVPPSGFIAGATAQSDRKIGLNKAPANMKLKGAFDLEFSVNQVQQDELNPIGINCIRKFEHSGIRVWGARTLSNESKWEYVNVRRVFLGIIKTLYNKLLWSVFEPNDSNLWKRIESTLNSYFQALISKGMTASQRPEEAYYVKCNDETNTRDIINSGQVIAEIGVALTNPAEFIIVTIKKTPESLMLVEEDV
ncbi:MAG: phage tail sheath family protein [Bacteroidales bacterium]|nr:phage tail sheath family protein [Bacteroidales bacterium]